MTPRSGRLPARLREAVVHPVLSTNKTRPTNIMKTLVTSLALAAIFALTSQATAQGTSTLKKGDKVMLACHNSKGWLSWYSGNWVVLNPAALPGTEGTWTVHMLTEDGDDRILIQLKNAKSETLMDGDNDNSVVLDDDDASTWYIPAAYATGGNITVYPNRAAALAAQKDFYPIYSDYWKEFALANKKNSVQDVVLRKSGLSFNGFLNAWGMKDKAPQIHFFFIKAG